MSNNTKIFSEAIAEAKAIRETAMANAKLALEEAFAPRIQEMMSDKLEAMSQEEDEMKEDYGQAEMDAVNDEISLEELLSELEGLEEGKEEMEEGKEEMDENTIAEAEADDEVGTISVDELKDIIRDIMADVMGGGEEGEEEAGEEEMEAGEEEMEASEDDLELEEILAEIASLEEGDDEMEEGLKDMAKKIGDKIKATVGPGGKMDQFIDKGAKITAKIAEPGSATKAIFREEELDEYGSSTMREPSDSAAAGLDNIINRLKNLSKKAGKSVADFVKDIELGKMSDAMREVELEESSELEEAMKTISTLRSELNEVNLLNAKLLYVNKLFKAKNLNESQKVKVINAFDRAETVREAKNVFDTLNESLNTEKAKSQIKESLSFASKSAGVSDRQPIMEGNDFVNRMQKLAGII
jgi:hypothetical protein